MTEIVNNVIVLFERFLAFLLNLIWIPAFINPPEDTPVDFVTKDWYILAGTYNNGKYHFYPASYDKAKAWRFRGHVSFPKLKISGKYHNVMMLLSPKSDHVWEYKDLRGQKHHVSYNTRKMLEDSPFNTTVEDKRTKIEEQSRKAKEQRHNTLKKIKGNSL